MLAQSWWDLEISTAIVEKGRGGRKGKEKSEVGEEKSRENLVRVG